MHDTIASKPLVLSDLSRNQLFFLLCIRLARELSLEDRNFQGFMYLLCGVSRVEDAFLAVRQILGCLGEAPRQPSIGCGTEEEISDDERILLEISAYQSPKNSLLARRLLPGANTDGLFLGIRALSGALRPFPAGGPSHVISAS